VRHCDWIVWIANESGAYFTFRITEELSKMVEKTFYILVNESTCLLVVL
jgi:hypothetical protein